MLSITLAALVTVSLCSKTMEYKICDFFRLSQASLKPLVFMFIPRPHQSGIRVHFALLPPPMGDLSFALGCFCPRALGETLLVKFSHSKDLFHGELYKMVRSSSHKGTSVTLRNHSPSVLKGPLHPCIQLPDVLQPALSSAGGVPGSFDCFSHSSAVGGGGPECWSPYAEVSSLSSCEHTNPTLDLALLTPGLCSRYLEISFLHLGFCGGGMNGKPVPGQWLLGVLA